MTPYEIASALIALAAIGVAWRSLTVAKESDTHAKAANRIAEDALGKAASANEIAVRANQISEDANALVGRSVSLQEEDWYVDWSPSWDQDQATLNLTNTGRDCARDISVVIVGEGGLHYIHVSDGLPVEAGMPLILAIPDVAQRRVEHDNSDWTRVRAMRSANIITTTSMFAMTVTATIHWRTGLGFPGTKTMEIKVT